MAKNEGAAENEAVENVAAQNEAAGITANFLFHSTPVDPSFAGRGSEAGGTFWIEVRAPASDQELDRLTADITIEPYGFPQNATSLAAGTTLYPFDGSIIHVSGLDGSGPNGKNYVFRAKATYSNSPDAQGPNGLRVKVGGNPTVEGDQP